jgi:hypothetical protein
MPAKDDAAPSPAERPSARYHRPDADEIRRAARRILRGGRATYPSQASFRAAVLDFLRRDDPLAVVSGTRLRRLALETPGVRLIVSYTEKPDGAPLLACPVCGSPLKPIRNRTLTGDSVVLGQQCTKCRYWTHSPRRVPTRYTFARAGVDPRAVTR